MILDVYYLKHSKQVYYGNPNASTGLIVVDAGSNAASQLASNDTALFEWQDVIFTAVHASHYWKQRCRI